MNFLFSIKTVTYVNKKSMTEFVHHCKHIKKRKESENCKDKKNF